MSIKSFNDLSKRDLLILASAVLIMTAVYLISSAVFYGVGFPLDDSWIHQTYARNFAQNGEWAFRAGVPSAGSTSPLWSVLLALGYVIGVHPLAWAYFLGDFILFALSVFCEIIARKLIQAYRPTFPWVGIVIACEWRFVWAAMSGMETLLHGLILTVVLLSLTITSRRYLTLGLLAGLSVWARPDGLTLIGPVLFTITLTELENKNRIAFIVKFLIGFGSLFVPYLLFNLAVGGTPMPNTFYAKQAEYAVWQDVPAIQKLGELFSSVSIGVGIALFPGFVVWFSKAIKERLWGSIAVLIWFVGYCYIYVSKLPLYQHGRYILPAMPALLLVGLMGLLEFDKSRLFGRAHWAVATIWRLSVALILVGFIFLGAKTYATDVAVIESEMVVSAKWIFANIPADSIVAAHDIGALGYFDDHELIDLAGLISPEVVPFIRDEAQIAAYLDRRGAGYLATFPDFYPQLATALSPVYTTNSEVTRSLGEENMIVFLWKTP